MKFFVSIILALLSIIPGAAYAEEKSNFAQPLIDDQDIYLEYTGKVLHNPELSEYMVEFYAENKTSRNILFRTQSAEINGVGVNAYLEDSVSGLCRGYIYLYILDTNMEALADIPDFHTEFDLQAISEIKNETDTIFDSVLSFDTGTPAQPKLFFDDLPGKQLSKDGEIADIRIEGIKRIEAYDFYEIYGYIRNNTDALIYAYAHNVNVAGTLMYDQTDFLIDSGKIGEFAVYVSDDMLYMSPDEDDEISFFIDIIDDSVSRDEQTGEYPPIDRTEMEITYKDLLSAK